MANCLICGNEFEKHTTGMYCSTRCRNLNRKSRTPHKTCKHCGVNFCPWPRTKGNGKKVICSDRCQTEFNFIKYKRKDQKRARKCEHCGIEFCALGRWSNRKFCSDKCFNRHWNILNGKVKSGSVHCEICNKEYEAFGNNKCCSNECAKISRSRYQIKYRKENKKEKIKICNFCLKEFKVTSKLKRYCSKECFNKSRIVYKIKEGKIERDNLKDGYIKSRIVFKSNLSRKDIPESLVEVYREYIKLKRILKPGGYKNDEHAGNSGSVERRGDGSSERQDHCGQG